MLINSFHRLSVRQKIIVLEALVILPFYRGIIQIIPLKIYSRFILGKHMEESLYDTCEDREELINDVSIIVNRMSGLMPWKNKCFAAAAAAKSILKRRGVESTLYLGLAKDKKMKVRAHSWLRAGKIYVTGGKGENYSVVSYFS